MEGPWSLSVQKEGTTAMRSFIDTIYEEAESKYQEANRKYLKSAENFFRLGASYEMIHEAMPDIPEETLREMESCAKKKKNPA